MISEENRVPVFQALSNLAGKGIAESFFCELSADHRSDLIPKVQSVGCGASTAGLDKNMQCNTAHKALWHSVWIAWHYTAMTLTHHDALLSTGIVEHGLPTALSSK